MRDFRFGGEGHGLGGVYNFAPFVCELTPSPYSHLNLCGRIPHNASALPDKTTLAPDASVSISSSLIDTHQPILSLAEVPSHIALQNNAAWDPAWPLVSFDAAEMGSPGMRAMLALAAAAGSQTLAFNVASNWHGSAPSAEVLPQELWPFARQMRLASSAPPTRGAWPRGAIVWAQVPSVELAGWLCAEGGSPGTWRGFGFTPTF